MELDNSMSIVYYYMGNTYRLMGEDEKPLNYLISI